MTWKTVKLGDVCKIINGSTPLRSRKDYWEGGTIPWFTIDDFREQGHNITYTNQKITKLALKETSVRMLPKNTVLLCCTASVGASAITRVEMATNQQFNGLIPNTDELIPEFLYYISTTITQKLINLSGSATINFIAISKLKELEISFPSILEQQLIVAKLDASFADIDKLINLEFLNIKNTESILTNSLSKIFLHKSKNSKEKEYELGKICKIVGGGTPSKSNPKFYEGEIPWATVRDMKNDIIEQTQFKINKEATIKSSTNIIPKENIVISTRVGLGKVCILKNDTAINQDLKGVIPINPKIVEVNFLFYWFKAISKIIVEFGTGLTVQGVKLPFIKS